MAYYALKQIYPDLHDDKVEVHPRAGNIFPKTTTKQRCWYCHNGKNLLSKSSGNSAVIRKEKDKWQLVISIKDYAASLYSEDPVYHCTIIPIDCCPKCGRTLI